MNRLPYALLLLIVLSVTSTAHATNFAWVSPLGGSFHTAGNWSPAGGPPDDGDDVAIFGFSSTMTVSFASDVLNDRLDMTANSGAVTFDLNGRAYTLDGSLAGQSLLVGSQTGDNADLILTDGNVFAQQDIRVGDAVGSDGTLVAGMDSILTTSQQVLIGRNGTGRLEVNGGFVQSAITTIGSQAGSSGELLVTGPASVYVNSNATGSGFVIGSLGQANVTVSGGGQLNAATAVVGAAAGGAGGNVTITGSGSLWTSTAAVTVGDLGMGTFELLDSAVAQSSSLVIGKRAGGNGTVTIQGSGSVFPPSVEPLWNISGSLTIGELGTGTLNVLGGGRLTAGGNVTIGTTSGGTGSFNLGGIGSVSMHQTGNTTLTIGSAVGSTGTLTFRSGGEYQTGTGLTRINATGVVNDEVQPGINVTREFIVNGDLLVDAGLINLPESRMLGPTPATVNIINGGRVMANFYGAPDGGTVNVVGSGSLLQAAGFASRISLTDGTQLNVTGGGRVDGRVVADGDIRIDGTGSRWTNGGDSILGVSGSPNLTVSNGATAVVTSLEVPSFQASPGSSEINVTSGGQLTASRLLFGNAPVATGLHHTTVNINGAGSRVTIDNGLPGQTSHLGSSSDQSATVNVQSGAMLTTGAQTLQINPTGHLSVDGGTLTLNGPLVVNGGSVAVNSGALMPATGSSITVQAGGIVNVIGSTSINQTNLTVSDAASQFNVTGSLSGGNGGTTTTLAGGTINAATFSMAGGGLLTGHGSVRGRVIVSDSSTTIAAGGGELRLGDPNNPLSIFVLGTLDVGTSALTLLSADRGDINNTNISGGTLTAANGIRMFASGTLSGNGTVNAALTNDGAITPSGTNGLTFGGIINGSGTGIAGTKLIFADGGGFLGAGSVDADIDSRPGSLITATGTLALGKGTSPDGFGLGGNLEVGSHSVTLNDADEALILSTGRATIQGGLLRSGNGLRIESVAGISSGRLDGSGIVRGDVNNHGTIAPGNSVGQLVFEHNLVHHIDGVLEIELGGTSSGSSDSLMLLGDLNLAGKLIVSAVGSYLPFPGDQFQIVDIAGSRSGEFDGISQGGLAGQIGQRQLYLSYAGGDGNDIVLSTRSAADFDQDGNLDCRDVDALVMEIVQGTNTGIFDLNHDRFVTVADLGSWLTEAGAVNLASGNPYLPGDANLDGFVDGSDFIIWNSNKFTSANGWCRADFNADGFVDGSDFIIWNAHKFTSSETLVAVPEPGGCGITMLCFVVLWVCGHCTERSSPIVA